MAKAILDRTNLLRHERFEQAPPQPQRRRRGRLPAGVVRLRDVPRIRPGVLAEIVNTRLKVNKGVRVRVLRYNGEDAWCWECQALSGVIRCNDGASSKTAWMKDEHLRRIWTGMGVRHG